MITVRPVRWPEDIPQATAIDPTFTTDRIYRVVAGDMGFTLDAEPCQVTKTLCSLAEEVPDLQKMEHVVLAERDGEVVGIAAASVSRWNGRAVLWHLYIQPAHRGVGAGRALLDSIEAYARQAGAWCIWLEAQNVNYPAIQFYRRHGFELCGLDRCLYDPKGPGGGETALYFARMLR